MQALLCYLTLTALSALVETGELSAAQSTNTENVARQPGGHRETEYHGGLVTPPIPKPAFTLTDTHGQAFDFLSKTDGYVTLLFFGYTHCSSVCPTQMSLVASALRELPNDVVKRCKVVFVTTDPQRDKPGVLRTWLDHFDKNFIGLTGTETAIEASQVAAHIPVTRGDPDGHAAFILAYTKDSLAHVIYPAGVTQADWIHDLPLLARETWTGH